MAALLHEVWKEQDEEGQWLPGLCLAGPDGEGFRALLNPNAQLVTKFIASCHFDAMSKYYEIVGYEKYVNEEPWSHEPYSDEEADRQAHR